MSATCLTTVPDISYVNQLSANVCQISDEYYFVEYVPNVGQISDNYVSEISVKYLLNI